MMNSGAFPGKNSVNLWGMTIHDRVGTFSPYLRLLEMAFPFTLLYDGPLLLYFSSASASYFALLDDNGVLNN